MNGSAADSPARVALVWPDDPGLVPSPSLDASRLSAVAGALRAAGIQPHPVVYADHAADHVRRTLSAFDAVLVWVNPIERGRDRSLLDAVLRDVAAGGVYVSAHPDVILAIGTKDVLYTTRAMSWGGDTHCHRTLAALGEGLEESLGHGTRVLKQYRGNGGNGVWKVERLPASSDAGSTIVRVTHALRGSAPREMTLGAFLASCAAYFDGDGRIIDQAFATRLGDGMIRCYLVGDRVEGFGVQAVNALLPATADGQPVLPGPRHYFPASREDLQPLKAMLEDTWLPELCSLTSIRRDDLPLIWDIDFLYGPKAADGSDTYRLCEINVSCVFPFPDSALAPMAEQLYRRMRSRRHTSP